MSKINVLNIVFIGLLLLIIFKLFSADKEIVIVDNSKEISGINDKIDSLSAQISHRDSVIDSLSKSSGKTIGAIRHYTKEYYTKEVVTERLQACDSVVSNCSQLIYYYQKTDSMHKAQAEDYKSIVVHKDSVIAIKDSIIVNSDKEIKSLKRRVWLWRGLAAAGTTIGLLAR
jgi:uncharacterized coiled-coil DUF342 family protein